MNNEDNHINESTSMPIKIKVNTAKGIYYITVDEIIYIKAENKYSTIYLVDSESIKTNHLLKWYTTHLQEPDFYRCHHSVIVNCRYVECICGNTLILKGDNIVPLSRNKKHPFENYLLNY